MLGPNGRPITRTELHAFDEIILDSADTNDAIEEFKARPWLKACQGGVRIYGDRSGKSKDTRSKSTDYEIIRQAGFADQRVPDSNPPIRDRHNVVNALLRNASGDVRVKIHSRCRTLAKGLELVKLKQGASYLEEETREQHVTTAFGYLAVATFPLMTPSAAGNVQRPWG